MDSELEQLEEGDLMRTLMRKQGQGTWSTHSTLSIGSRPGPHL